MSPDYEIVVGLEVHAQLLTRSKLFCGDTGKFGEDPNTQVSVISLGYPGTLPMLNKEALHLAVKLGLACNCDISRVTWFDRKNYFYPDLPKGYQITQHTHPICRSGHLVIHTSAGIKKIRLNRIHLEEDAGKSIHADEHHSAIDFNRAGMPLVEIVTEPDIRSAEEAYAFVSQLRKLVRQLGVCDGNMEEGSFRCDVNISVRKKGDEKLGTKVEIKNLNSLRFIKKAIDHEAERLISIHRSGTGMLQQTRGFHEESSTTYTIRTKEDEDDYRYFPDPDLSSFSLEEEWIAEIRKGLPPSQDDIIARLKKEYHLSAYDAGRIAKDIELTALFFDLAGMVSSKNAANWIIGPVTNHLSSNDISFDESGLKTEAIALLINQVEKGKINYGTAVQKVFPEMIKHPEMDISKFIEEEGLLMQDSEDELASWIDAAFEKHALKVIEYKKGKKGVISLFVGEVMKLSKGRADARKVNEKILEKINREE